MGISKDSFATSNSFNSHENLSSSPTSYVRSSRKILSTSLPQKSVGVVPDLVGAFVGIEVGCKETIKMNGRHVRKGDEVVVICIADLVVNLHLLKET